MIPKVIHYCWFGGNDMPAIAARCIESWKKYCPDYEIVEWNENNFDISSAPIYVQQAYSAKKWAFVTDYVRLDVIYQHGGIYLDTDVELIKCLDPLLTYNGYFGYESYDGNLRINTGLGFGAIPELQILKDLMDDYTECRFLTEDGGYDLMPCPQRNAPIFAKYGAAGDRKKQLLDDNVLILPKEYLCPLDYQTGRKNVTEDTLSIHWFSASWVDEAVKKYKRRLDSLARFMGRHNADVILGVISCIKKEGITSYVAKRVKKYVKHE